MALQNNEKAARRLRRAASLSFGRPASQEFESAAEALLAEFLVPTLQNRMLEGIIDSALEDCEADAVAEMVG